jgi:hypothetical protein
MANVTLVGTVTHNESQSSLGNIATTRNGIVAGNLIVVCVTNEDAQTITNVSDGTTTVTTPDVAFDWGAGTQRMAFYSFPNHTGGNFTFTATYNTLTAFRGIYVIELANADSSAPFVAGASASGSSTTPSSGNVTPTITANGCYILGFLVSGAALASTMTPTGGFADLVNDSTVLEVDLSGLAQSTAGAVAATWTQPSAGWGVIAAAYQPAATIVSAAISGTITAATLEADIVAGSKTIIITLTGDTWILP